MITASALDSHVCDMTFETTVNHLTITAFYNNVRTQLDDYLLFLMNNHHEWKIHSCLDVEMCKGKLKSSGEQVETFGFRHSARPVSEIDINEEIEKMEKRLEEFCQRGSNWVLQKIIHLKWCRTAYNSIPRHIGHHRQFKLPLELKKKKAVINVIDAPQDECFK